jgi:hypothetical protein
MTDAVVADKIEEIAEHIIAINSIMQELHDQHVEIRIAYKEPEKGNPPRLDLWRATAHIDYLRNPT